MESRKIRMVIVALTALAGCASKGPLTFNDDLVVPGERIGEVMIGMPLAQLLALKGEPLKTIPIEGTEATTYGFDGLVVGAHDTVYWIIAKDPRFRTTDGVAPGVEQIFARSAFGEPKCVVTRGNATVYDYKDVYFEVDNASGKVTELGVQKKTRTCKK